MAKPASAFWALVRRLRAAELWCSRTREGRRPPVAVVLHVAGLSIGRDTLPAAEESLLVRALSLTRPETAMILVAGVRRFRCQPSIGDLTDAELRYSLRALARRPA